jgi:DNA-binding beta-propeller fold protein YncE
VHSGARFLAAERASSASLLGFAGGIRPCFVTGHTQKSAEIESTNSESQTWLLEPFKENQPMSIKLRFVLLVSTAACLVASNGCSNTSSSHASSSANSLWVASNDHMVRSYTIDQTNGSIAPIGSDGDPISTGTQPASIALSPDRLTLFVANAGDNTINLYTIGSNGSLTSAGAAVQAGNMPSALAVDPAFALLFVADKGSDSILTFSILPGALVLKASFAIQIPAAAGGSGPVALAVSPSGFSCTDNRTPVPVIQKCFALYAANQTAGTVTAYDYFVDSSGNFVRGAVDLSGNFIVGGSVTGSPYSAGTSPAAIAFSRCAGAGSSPAVPCQSAGLNGLLVANSASNDLIVFSACIQLPSCQFGESGPDGSLSQVGVPVAAGSNPSAVLVDPGSDFFYVVDSGSNQISGYQYTSATGAITALGVASPTGGSVLSGAITPNLGSTHNWVVLGGSGVLSTFGIGSDGTLTAVGSGQTVPAQSSALLVQ